MKLKELLEKSRLVDAATVKEFHRWREHAFEAAIAVYKDRAAAYNYDYESVEEMIYGPVSLASEIHKRATRMSGILSPTRPVDLSPTDLNRLLDLCVDNLNYTSWLYALLRIATGQEGNKLSDDSPDYLAPKPVQGSLGEFRS